MNRHPPPYFLDGPGSQWTDVGDCDSLGRGADADLEKGLEALRAYKVGAVPGSV